MKYRDRIVGLIRIRGDRILPNPLNWRTHPEEQRGAMRGVLADIGVAGSLKAVPADEAKAREVLALKTQAEREAWLRAFEVSTADVLLLDGHLRAEEIRDQPVAVELLDLLPAEQAEFLATFDPIGALAGRNAAKLDETLRAFNSTNADVQALVAKIRAEGEAALGGFGADAGGNESDAPLPEGADDAADEDEGAAEGPPMSDVGEVFELGPHRLLCGDSNDMEAIGRMLRGTRVAMIYTDPPYGMNLNVDFDEMFGNDPAHRQTGERFVPVDGDDRPYDPAPMMEYFRTVAEQFWWGADYYAEKIERRVDGSWVVWDKRCDDNMDKVAGNVFELCWSKAKHKRLVCRMLWSGHHGMASDDTKKRIHPTQKPAALAKWFFERWGSRGDVVFDGYGGSGSTLIGAHLAGRVAYIVEKDRVYCDRIRRRWGTFAKKIGTDAGRGAIA